MSLELPIETRKTYLETHLASLDVIVTRIARNQTLVAKPTCCVLFGVHGKNRLSPCSHGLKMVIFAALRR